MITKEALKGEVDKIPENLLDQVHMLLKKIVAEGNRHNVYATEDWEKWRANLDQFTADFMANRNQSSFQPRESFD